VKKLISFFTSRGQLKEALLVAQVLLCTTVWEMYVCVCYVFSYSFLTLKMTSVCKRLALLTFAKWLNNTLLFCIVLTNFYAEIIKRYLIFTDFKPDSSEL